ncbi:hypothetical protein D3C73_1609970 [compost metagenome]
MFRFNAANYIGVSKIIIDVECLIVSTGNVNNVATIEALATKASCAIKNTLSNNNNQYQEAE